VAALIPAPAGFTAAPTGLIAAVAGINPAPAAVTAAPTGIIPAVSGMTPDGMVVIRNFNLQ
jgi:hypothetical protein